MMRWAVILCLIVGVGAGAGASASAGAGAGASARAGARAGAGASADAGATKVQAKDSSAELSRRSVRAEAEAKAAFERGRAAHNARKTDEAVSAFERAVELEPTSSLYHMWLGHAYSRQLSTAGLLRKPFIARRSGEAYNMAVKLDPTSLEAAEGRLEFLLGAPGIVGGGVDKARAEAARIGTLDAYRGAMAKARIAEHEKQWPEAERLYRSLLAEYPDRSAAMDTLMTILLNGQRYDEAFKLVDDRLARLPDETSTLYNLGRVSAVSGQHLARGEAALRRFLAMTGGDPGRQSNAHYRLGMIKEKMGDLPAAAGEYRAAIDLYPRHQPAAAALKKIQPR